MKRLSPIFVVLIGFLLFAGCIGKKDDIKDRVSKNIVAVPDTGFTGVRQVMQRGYLLKEISFKNGVRQGETKTYTSNGELYQTFWYENGLRQDTGKWYYNQGEVFRTTPYIDDTIQGIVTQYYRTGKLRAKIGYEKGMRTPFFEEYYSSGLLYKDYPEIIASITDNYNSNGTYKIDLSLTQADQNVIFYKGSFTENRFDTAAVEQLYVKDSQASIVLKKVEGTTVDTVGIIASILTPYGNRYITTKSIKLPYNNLK